MTLHRNETAHDTHQRLTGIDAPGSTLPPAGLCVGHEAIDVDAVRDHDRSLGRVTGRDEMAPYRARVDDHEIRISRQVSRRSDRQVREPVARSPRRTRDTLAPHDAQPGEARAEP